MCETLDKLSISFLLPLPSQSHQYVPVIHVQLNMLQGWKLFQRQTQVRQQPKHLPALLAIRFALAGAPLSTLCWEKLWRPADRLCCISLSRSNTEKLKFSPCLWGLFAAWHKSSKAFPFTQPLQLRIVWRWSQDSHNSETGEETMLELCAYPFTSLNVGRYGSHAWTQGYPD